MSMRVFDGGAPNFTSGGRPLRWQRIVLGALVGFGCSNVSSGTASSGSTGGTSVRSVSAHAGNFVEVAGSPGIISLVLASGTLQLPAYEVDGQVVVALPPLVPGTTAQLLRGSTVVRSLVIADNPQAGPLGSTATAFVQQALMLVNALPPPADATALNVHNEAVSAANDGFNLLLAHLGAVQGGATVMIPSTSGSVVFDSSSAAVLDQLFAGLREPVISLSSSPGQPLTGDQVTTDLALIGGAMIVAAIATTASPAIGAAGLFIAFGGAPVLGVVADLANGATASATAMATSSDPGASDSVMSEVVESAQSAIQTGGGQLTMAFNSLQGWLSPSSDESSVTDESATALTNAEALEGSGASSSGGTTSGPPSSGGMTGGSATGDSTGTDSGGTGTQGATNSSTGTGTSASGSTGTGTTGNLLVGTWYVNEGADSVHTSVTVTLTLNADDTWLYIDQSVFAINPGSTESGCTATEVSSNYDGGGSWFTGLGDDGGPTLTLPYSAVSNWLTATGCTRSGADVSLSGPRTLGDETSSYSVSSTQLTFDEASWARQ